MISKLTPCKGCPDRHVGCHSPECQKWVEFEKRHKEEKEKEYANRKKDALYAGYIIDLNNKIQKSRRKRKGRA